MIEGLFVSPHPSMTVWWVLLRFFFFLRLTVGYLKDLE